MCHYPPITPGAPRCLCRQGSEPAPVSTLGTGHVLWRLTRARRCDAMPTPVEAFRHRLPVRSLPQPPSEPVACCAWLDAAPHGKRAPGRGQRWHGTCLRELCASIAYAKVRVDWRREPQRAACVEAVEQAEEKRTLHQAPNAITLPLPLAQCDGIAGRYRHATPLSQAQTSLGLRPGAARLRPGAVFAQTPCRFCTPRQHVTTWP
jgi:hypothetical protein